MRQKRSKWKLIDLSKQIDIEIAWSEKNIGKKQELITFEKDGKKYQVLMTINKIKKGWFKDKIIDYTFKSLSPEKFTIYRPNFWKKSGWMPWAGTERYRYDKIEPTQKRWGGFVLIGVIFSFLLMVSMIWWRKKNKFKKRGV